MKNLPLRPSCNLQGDPLYPPTIFQFSRSEFCSHNFARLLAHFCPSQRTPSSLMALRHSVGLQLPESGLMGWTPCIDDETRVFAQELLSAFPYWGYFFSLRLPALWTLSVALLDDVELIRIGAATQVRLLGHGLAQVIEQHLGQADALAQCAGASPHERSAIAVDLRNYFLKSARLGGVVI
ncbi:MAG: hypothetical protein JSR82_10190 [Verrucomicrobia bacterium]|nr:hypothetical protein [Verrucomicrobiota bacterium]